MSRTNCMFSKSTCLETNSGTYFEFLVPAVAEKFPGRLSGPVSQIFTFPAIHALTKLFITFDRFSQFS
jgi:hypothetical protein